MYRHLDEEVADLGAENMKKYWKLEEVDRRNKEVLERVVAGQSSAEEQARIRRRWPFQEGAWSLTAEPCR